MLMKYFLEVILKLLIVYIRILFGRKSQKTQLLLI